MIYFLFIIQSLLCFFAVLNGFLNGISKTRIDNVLGFFFLGIIASIFLLEGWKVGLLSVFLAFIFSGLSMPIAKIVARKLLDKEWLENKIGFLFK